MNHRLVGMWLIKFTHGIKEWSADQVENADTWKWNNLRAYNSLVSDTRRWEE